MTHPDVKTLVSAWIALLVLLAATYAAYFVDLGTLNTAIAFTIAIAKALVVLAVFMHLYYGNSLTRVLSGVGFLWLTFLLGIIMTDYAARHPSIFNF